jgi:chaperonin GroEL
VTLGPRGRNVAIERLEGSPTITKDGVTVAREIDLPSRMDNVGARLVKEVASRTGDAIGDGTTTATVLAQALYKQGLQLVEAGLDGMELKRGLDAALPLVRKALKAQSYIPSSSLEIAQVGTISANGDTTVGKILAEAFDKVGKDGVTMVEESKATETKLNVVDGLQFDRGYVSSYFITDPRRLIAELDKPYILVVEDRVQKISQILKALEIVRAARASLLVIAEDIVGEGLAALTINKLKGVIQCAAVKIPGFGERKKEILHDIAIAVGATPFTAESGRNLETVRPQDLGRAEKAVVEKELCRIVKGAGDPEAIAQRIRTIEGHIERSKSEYEKDRSRERMARLGAGIAIIQVGGYSETEVRAKRHLMEDALAATRSAMRDGLVPGGGVALLRARAALHAMLTEVTGDRRAGIRLLYDACAAPLFQIADNAGEEGAVVVHRVAEGRGAFGYDARALEYGDMLEKGIVDPLQVVDVAIEKAVSVASMMLTTGALIVERPSASPRGPKKP